MNASLLFLMLLLGFTLSIAPISALSWWEMGPYAVRDHINHRIMSIEAPTPTVGSVENHMVRRDCRETPIRIYTPNEGTPCPVILLIHGGAWVAGNLDTHDNLARYLCSQAVALVVSVGYLNAPEGKFPLALEQCCDTLEWVRDHAMQISADCSRLAIIGDSAGGNMSAALCLMLRDRNGPKADVQVLINPAPDLSCDGTFERKGDGLDPLRWQAQQYLSDLRDAFHPYVSPLVAEDLSHLPPAMVILAEKDDLYDAGLRYAQRLESSGIPATIYCQKGIGHLAGDGARASLKARESLDVAVEAIKKAFSE